MYSGEISLTICKIVGIWHSESLRGNCAIIYHLFSSSVACLICVFTISNVLYLIQENYDMEKFTESLFYVLALSTGCVKMIVIFQKHHEIIELKQLLLNEQFVPRDAEEIFIQRKFDKFGRYIFLILSVSLLLYLPKRV